MVGPIVHQEMLLGSRRNKLHILRWIYAGWLISQVFWYFVSFQAQQGSRTWVAGMNRSEERQVLVSGPEVVGRWFTEMFVAQQMILLVLATPAFVAGAVTDEKRRGTLQYLLTTDLEARHIILGKLLGRVAQVALLALAGLPLFFFLAGFAGASPFSLIIALLTLVVPLLALGAMTLLASVWCRQTRDAVLGLYLVGILGWLLIWWLGGPLNYFDPMFVLAPAWGPMRTIDWPELGERLALSGLCWGGLGAVCLTLAIWRLRPAYIRELESSGPTTEHWYAPARAPVDDQPVRWRERHVEGLAPMQGLRRVPTWLAVVCILALTIGSSLLILITTMAPGTTIQDVLHALVVFDLLKVESIFPSASTGFMVQGILVMLLASLIVGIRCSGAVTGERERKTWEPLLLTPLTARELIRGKLWGVMRASYGYLLAYGVPAVVLSLAGGPLAAFSTILWLGVTVLAMYFVGAAGLWCSVKSKNSWRSLLSTLGLGYLGGSAIYAVSSLPISVLALLLFLALVIIDATLGTKIAPTGLGFPMFMKLFFIASCIGLAIIFLLMAELFLKWAQRWIADRERTRHWNEEPTYRRRKRVTL